MNKNNVNHYPYASETIPLNGVLIESKPYSSRAGDQFLRVVLVKLPNEYVVWTHNMLTGGFNHGDYVSTISAAVNCFNNRGYDDHDQDVDLQVSRCTCTDCGKTFDHGSEGDNENICLRCERIALTQSMDGSEYEHMDIEESQRGHK